MAEKNLGRSFSTFSWQHYDELQDLLAVPVADR
jgi:hypothetical protein